MEEQMAKAFDREIQRILREEMLLEESLNQPRLAALVRYERDVRKMLDQGLRQSGLDTKALKVLRADHQRESRRAAEKIKRLASKQGAALHKGVVTQAKALRAMASPATGPVPGGMLVVLDTPRSIVTSPNPAVLTDSRISPGDNFAKIRVDRKNRGRDRLNFVFTWQNPGDLPVIVDAGATLSASGALDLHMNDGWGGNPGFIDVSTRMSVGRFLIPFAAVSGPHFIRSIFAFNYPWWPAQDAGGPASAAVDHSVRGFHLAGNATLLIRVSLTVFSDFDDGRGIADFDFGLLGVGVPQVTLSITRPNVFVAQG
jgi:hypothetical protein